MTKPLVYVRAGDGCVELVTVTPETVDGQPMPVVRVISLDAGRAIQIGHSAIGEGLRLQAELSRVSDAG